MATNVAKTLGPDRRRMYDVLKEWWGDDRYVFVSATVKNPAAATLAAGGLVPGMPVKLVATQWTILLSGDEANVKGIYLGNDLVAIPEALAQNAITQQSYRILVRGPAVINKDATPTTDPNGANYDWSALSTALAALNPPIMTQAGPLNTNIQNT
jgi:hypothetical protein